MPYQLHCCPLTALDAVELLTLLTGADETGAELGVDDVARPQILPVMVGRSALPPRLSIWKPNCTLCPG